MAATQISTSNLGVAALAFDGNERSCSRTGWANESWWEVDLGSSYQIQAVQVTSLKRFSSLMYPFQVLVDGDVCATVQSSPQTFTPHVSCQSIGRKLKIASQNKSFLALCEVKINGVTRGLGGGSLDEKLKSNISGNAADEEDFGEGSPEESSNTSINGTDWKNETGRQELDERSAGETSNISDNATDEKNAGEGSASEESNTSRVATDGKNTTVGQDTSESRAGEKLNVSNNSVDNAIDVNNATGFEDASESRGSTMSNRSSNGSEEDDLGERTLGAISNKSSNATDEGDIDQATENEIGTEEEKERVVDEIKALKEQVKRLAQEAEGWLNLKDKFVHQSSVAVGGEANRAVDGFSSASFADKSCTRTHSAHGAWWEVNLGANYTLRAVQVTSRSNPAKSLNPLQVTVDGRACVRGATVESGSTREFPCKTTGSALRIALQKTGTLTLCEVKVKGVKVEDISEEPVGSASSDFRNEEKGNLSGSPEDTNVNISPTVLNETSKSMEQIGNQTQKGLEEDDPESLEVKTRVADVGVRCPISLTQAECQQVADQENKVLRLVNMTKDTRPQGCFVATVPDVIFYNDVKDGQFNAPFRAVCKQNERDDAAQSRGNVPADIVKIKFLPTINSPIPDGWMVDTGERFGRRTNLVTDEQFVYGWHCGLGSTAIVSRDQEGFNAIENTVALPDKTGNCSNESWQISLQDGYYEVDVVVQDTSTESTTSGCRLEGLPLGIGTVSLGAVGTATLKVLVNNGRLTLSGSANAGCSSINRIVIRPAEITLPWTPGEGCNPISTKGFDCLAPGTETLDADWMTNPPDCRKELLDENVNLFMPGEAIFTRKSVDIDMNESRQLSNIIVYHVGMGCSAYDVQYRDAGTWTTACSVPNRLGWTGMLQDTCSALPGKKIRHLRIQSTRNDECRFGKNSTQDWLRLIGIQLFAASDECRKPSVLQDMPAKVVFKAMRLDMPGDGSGAVNLTRRQIVSGGGSRSLTFDMQAKSRGGASIRDQYILYTGTRAPAYLFAVKIGRQGRLCVEGVGWDGRLVCGTSSETDLMDGAWHSVVIIYTGLPDHKVKVYVDGAIEGRGVADPPFVTYPSTSRNYFGRRDDFGEDGTGSFVGSISRVVYASGTPVN
eukprot:TRINITY_DN15531_c0_g1_i5.p1 TRINITY_DN15531_c0_g1~~TRINITY_DN15531_c0_g1_i5.p1  ORF type:complete len:1212 (-),score=193.33 TRINITY_DN15531_c0_g1_i5:268-3651(-)